MKLIPRKGIRLGLVAGLVATGLVGVTSLTASGAPTQSAGTIVVDAVAPPDGTGKLLATVEYRDGLGSVVATQTISANGPCDTLVNAGDRILSVGTTPSDSRPVLVNDGLGVLSGNQNCGAEGVIDRTEALILELGDYFKNTALFDTDVYALETKLEVLRSGSPVRLAVTRDNNAVEERTVAQGIIEEETFGRWDERLVVSSTANRFNRGIVLVNATFTLERTVANQAPSASFTATRQAAPNVRTVDFDEASSDPDGTVVTWEWRFGDGTIKTINRVTGSVESGDTSHTYAEDGSYPVTLTVTDNLGRTFTTTSQNVDIVNQAPTASFTATVQAAPNVRTVVFDETSSDPDGTVVRWEWDFGDDTPIKTINRSTTVVSGDTSHTYAAADSYTVTLTVTDNLGRTFTTTPQNVDILNQAPTASFTWDATTLTVDFLDGSSDPDLDGTVVRWEWDFGDDTPIKTINRSTTVVSGDTSHTYAAADSYTVSLTVTDNLGQTSTAFTTLVTVEGTAVFCSEPVTASGNAATATFLRGENGDKFTDPCADVGVIVEVVADTELGDYVFWDNSFTGVDGTPQDVNGLVTVTWLNINPANSDEVARMNNREIDYTGLEDGIQRKRQSYCLDFKRTDIPGVDEERDKVVFDVLLPDWPYFLADGIPEPGFIEVNGVKKVPWCLVSDTRVVDEFGNITQTEVLYGRGDPAKFK